MYYVGWASPTIGRFFGFGEVICYITIRQEINESVGETHLT